MERLVGPRSGGFIGEVKTLELKDILKESQFFSKSILLRHIKD